MGGGGGVASHKKNNIFLVERHKYLHGTHWIAFHTLKCKHLAVFSSPQKSIIFLVLKSGCWIFRERRTATTIWWRCTRSTLTGTCSPWTWPCSSTATFVEATSTSRGNLSPPRRARTQLKWRSWTSPAPSALTLTTQSPSTDALTPQILLGWRLAREWFLFAAAKNAKILNAIFQIQDCGMVLEEQPGKVSEAFRLFLQGQGYGKCSTPQ